jgi:hypothetical protein
MVKTRSEERYARSDSTSYAAAFLFVILPLPTPRINAQLCPVPKHTESKQESMVNTVGVENMGRIHAVTRGRAEGGRGPPLGQLGSKREVTPDRPMAPAKNKSYQGGRNTRLVSMIALLDEEF